MSAFSHVSVRRPSHRHSLSVYVLTILGGVHPFRMFHVSAYHLPNFIMCFFIRRFYFRTLCSSAFFIPALDARTDAFAVVAVTPENEPLFHNLLQHRIYRVICLTYTVTRSSGRNRYSYMLFFLYFICSSCSCFCLLRDCEEYGFPHSATCGVPSLAFYTRLQRSNARRHTLSEWQMTPFVPRIFYCSSSCFSAFGVKS